MTTCCKCGDVSYGYHYLVEGDYMCSRCLPREVVALRAVSDGRLKELVRLAGEMEKMQAANNELRALLREALEAAWLDDEWWGNEIPDEWFVRVKAALEGKS